jgi:DNA processing protein
VSAVLSFVQFTARFRHDPHMNADTISCWLALARIPGIGPRARIVLLEHFGRPNEVFAAPRAVLAKAFNEAVTDGMRIDPTTALDAILRGPGANLNQADLDWFAQPGHHLVVWTDPDYPPLLREISDPPLVLYVKGDRSLLMHPQIAIVGSRNPTPVGRENAHAFGGALANAGLVVTSGLALGIDAAAHRGALDTGRPTIAVTGTGLDRVYPARNRDLAHAIADRGALVSEFPIGTPPLPENFPRRNRLISGMSVGVLVVEAALQSGSLITARLAAEQGREVYALPGSIHSPLARGCHALIRQGAKLVETAEHVVEELAPLVQVALTSGTATKEPPRLSAVEAQLLDCLDDLPTSIDVVVERSGLTADTVSSILLQLELRGLVLVGSHGYQRAP